VETPQALTTKIQDKGINISLINKEGEYQDAPIVFYELNLTSRGIDFNDFPEQNTDIFLGMQFSSIASIPFVTSQNAHFHRSRKQKEASQFSFRT
jgi:hypothetical protein